MAGTGLRMGRVFGWIKPIVAIDTRQGNHILKPRHVARRAAPAEVFIFSLYLDDGDVHDGTQPCDRLV